MYLVHSIDDNGWYWQTRDRVSVLYASRQLAIDARRNGTEWMEMGR